MTSTKTVTIGLILMVILATSIILTFNNEVQFKITKTSSSFYILENSNWVLAGSESNQLYNGTTLVTSISSQSSVKQETNGDNIKITRNTNYSNGATIIDTYLFNGANSNIELFPISHTIEILNANGLEYRYNLKDIVSTKVGSNLQSPQSFERRMKVEYDNSFKSNKLNAKSMVIKYDINSNYKVYNIRLFDPINVYNYCYQEFANISTACGGLSTGSYTGDGSLDFSPMYDGDWNTYITALPTESIVYINYTKPLGVNINNSYWIVKYNYQDATSFLIPRDCQLNSNNVLMLRFSIRQSVGGPTYKYVRGECHDEAANDWPVIFEDNPVNGIVYEEAMNWSIGKANVTINYPINNTIYNSYISRINFTTNYIGLINCSYNLGGQNVSFNCSRNITNLTSNYGNNNWTIYISDGIDNLSQSVTFTQNYPEVPITYSNGIGALIFKPNSRFDQRLWPSNQTYSKGVYNLTNTINRPYTSIWMNVSNTLPTWQFQCNNGTSGNWTNINNNLTQVHSSLNVNRSQMIWCRVNLNNATTAWNFNVTFEGRI